MRFLGIDQSFTSTGVTVLDQSGNLIHSAIIKSIPSNSHFKRAWDILKAIEKIILDYQINHIAIEGLALAKIGNATRSLAILQGILVANLQYNPPSNHKLSTNEILIVAPRCLKKFATGKGTAKKAEMIAALPDQIKNQMGSQSKSTLSDLADAYHLANYLKMMKHKPVLKIKRKSNDDVVCTGTLLPHHDP